jgi:pSer/pThr/pTyr-binding forkhead associated (FHA) protein
MPMRRGSIFAGRRRLRRRHRCIVTRRPCRRGRPPRLVCVGGSQKDHSFPITAAGITIGREPKNDVVLADPRVSYHHAWIGIVDQKAVLRDLGSTNGTFLNAQIDAPVSEVVLSPGDTIFFGGHGRDQFRFVLD